MEPQSFIIRSDRNISLSVVLYSRMNKFISKRKTYCMILAVISLYICIFWCEMSFVHFIYSYNLSDNEVWLLDFVVLTSFSFGFLVINLLFLWTFFFIFIFIYMACCKSRYKKVDYGIVGFDESEDEKNDEKKYQINEPSTFEKDKLTVDTNIKNK